MKLRVLGCSGGIGIRQPETTALLVDEDILIDAGTGLTQLTLDELAAIDHVFLTHTHLDHIAGLPLLLDSVSSLRQQPVRVYALPEAISALQAHIFNDQIWPDFSSIPCAESPLLRFHPLLPGGETLLRGRRIRLLPVWHTVAATGYWLDSGQGSLAFSGDTGLWPEFWTQLNAITNLRYLLVECAFPNHDCWLAERSQHFCPSLLIEGLKLLQQRCPIGITHLKPGAAALTMNELRQSLPAHCGPLFQLEAGQQLEF
jgi:ribonuclease BN (tRNA processing enzyme)